MRQMSGEEPEQRPEETGVTPQNDNGVGVPSQKKPKRKFSPPSVRTQWIIAGIALALNIGITFTTKPPYMGFQSMLVTATFLYLFGFAIVATIRFVRGLPEGSESNGLWDAYQGHRATKKLQQWQDGALSATEQRSLDELEASLVPKKEQFDVIVYRDLWKVWEKDHRSAG